MWDGKRKAVTFSYDDGMETDRHLVEIFNRYGMKATFNLNSGLQTGRETYDVGGPVLRRPGPRGLAELYAGHEIAAHSLTHPYLDGLPPEELRREIQEDVENLRKMFSQEIVGFAYPYGRYNDVVREAVRGAGLRYARTAEEGGGFGLPNDPLAFTATCRHTNPQLMEYVRRFVEEEREGLSLLCVWGHSFEFERDGNWALIEELCEWLSGREGLYFCTNAQALLGDGS